MRQNRPERGSVRPLFGHAQQFFRRFQRKEPGDAAAIKRRIQPGSDADLRPTRAPNDLRSVARCLRCASRSRRPRQHHLCDTHAPSNPCSVRAGVGKSGVDGASSDGDPKYHLRSRRLSIILKSHMLQVVAVTIKSARRGRCEKSVTMRTVRPAIPSRCRFTRVRSGGLLASTAS
jgi:hypothetical protein